VYLFLRSKKAILLAKIFYFAAECRKRISCYLCRNMIDLGQLYDRRLPEMGAATNIAQQARMNWGLKL